MSLVTLSGIRVVVFDLDDTLYPERSFAFSGFEAVARWLGERMDCPIDPAVRMRELFDTADRRHVFDQLLSEIGCDQPQHWVPAMVQCYRTHRPSIGLCPDADAFLARWCHALPLALISDGPLGVQQAKIRALGLVDRLDHIILTDGWGSAFWKPHPRAFREIQTTFQVAGQQCVYIADNVEKDFIAPRELGWRTVRIRRPDGIYANALPPPGGEPETELACLTNIELSS